MQREINNPLVTQKYVLCAVTMVTVEIDNRYPLYPLQDSHDSDSDVIEVAKTSQRIRSGVMPGLGLSSITF